MGFVVLILSYVAPIFGVLAAIHLHRRIRSPETIVLLASGIVVILSVSLQLLGMIVGPILGPELGSFGLRALGYIGGYSSWSWTIGNFAYLLMLYLVVRKSLLVRDNDGGASRSSDACSA